MMTADDRRAGLERGEDAMEFEGLLPEMEQALEAKLMAWAEGQRMPRPALERIRRSVLEADPAYEPLSRQWWARVLASATSVARATPAVRSFLAPAWDVA